MTTEPVDAQVVDDGAGTALVERPAAGLFRTDDPAEVVVAASKVAGTLRDVLRRQRMVSTIGGREHVLVEGWTTLGSMPAQRRRDVAPAIRRNASGTAVGSEGRSMAEPAIVPPLEFVKAAAGTRRPARVRSNPSTKVPPRPLARPGGVTHGG